MFTHGLGGTVGGTGAGEANTIAYNTGDGVAVVDGSALHRIRGNRVYDNGGLGIDLDDDGPSANDAAATGTAAPTNCRTSRSWDRFGRGVRARSCSLDLDSGPNASYEVDFYANGSGCDAMGRGKAQRYLGSATVATDGTGFVSTDVVLHVGWCPARRSRRRRPTRWEARRSSRRARSRACVNQSVQSLLVTNTNDSGPGVAAQRDPAGERVPGVGP